MSKKLAVLASGTGTIFKSIIQAGLPVELLLTDRVCRAINIAEEAGIKSATIPRTFDSSFDRTAHTQEVIKALHKHSIEVVALAGYMTVFAKPMFEKGGFAGKILNTHPSLLPAFRGENAVADALEWGVKVTGCTIHEVTIEMDEGPILEQVTVRVLPEDTIESLHEGIKIKERRLYPKIIRQFLESG